MNCFSHVVTTLLICLCWLPWSLARQEGPSFEVPNSGWPSARRLQDNTLLVAVSSDQTLSSLAGAVPRGDLAAALSAPGPLTLFAPVDEAFALIDPDFLKRLLNDQDWVLHLRDLLFFHLVRGSFPEGELLTGQILPMLNQENLTIAIDTNTSSVTLSSSFSDPSTSILEANINATNGLIHKINRVLLPNFVGTDIVTLLGQVEGLESFSVLLSDTGIASQLLDGLFTIFAPTNDAMNQLGELLLTRRLQDNSTNEITAILRNHVVPGVHPSVRLESGTALVTLAGLEVVVNVVDEESVFVSNSQVVQRDGLASNGIVHMVDSIFSVSNTSNSPTTSPVAGEIQTQLPSINDTLNDLASLVDSDDDLATLSNALRASNLTLPDGVLTIFGAVNSAFEALDNEFVANLFFGQYVQHLAEILLFHVTDEDAFLAEDLEDGQNITMLNGEIVTVNIETTPTSNRIYLTSPNTESSNVTVADLSAFNGILHKVDGVLLPAFVNRPLLALANTSAGTGFETFFELLGLTNFGIGLPSGSNTILAPVNEAFEALGAEELSRLQLEENREELQGILSNHIFQGIYPSVLLTNGYQITAFGGSGAITVITNDGISFNNAEVVVPDVLASDGIVHGINGLVLTKRLSRLIEGEADLFTLNDILATAKLTNFSDGNYTFFAPINSAFENLDDATTNFLEILRDQPEFILHLRDLALLHVHDEIILSPDLMVASMNISMESGDTILLDVTGESGVGLTDPNNGTAGFLETNLVALNGVIHKIDTVMLPPFVFANSLEQMRKFDELSIFLDLLARAFPEGFPSGALYNTILAPTNEAFQNIGNNTLEMLRNETNVDMLRDVLLIHIIQGVIPSVLLEDGATYVSLGQQSLGVSVGDVVMFDDAAVVNPNVLANDGIIHIINKTITAETPPPIPVIDTIRPPSLPPTFTRPTRPPGAPTLSQLTRAPVTPLETTSDSWPMTYFLGAITTLGATFLFLM